MHKSESPSWICKHWISSVSSLRYWWLIWLMRQQDGWLQYGHIIWAGGGLLHLSLHWLQHIHDVGIDKNGRKAAGLYQRTLLPFRYLLLLRHWSRDHSVHFPVEYSVHDWCWCFSGCDQCNEWYHGTCIGVTQGEADGIKHFFCDSCRGVLSTGRGNWKKSTLKLLWHFRNCRPCVRFNSCSVFVFHRTRSNPEDWVQERQTTERHLV